jgi:hypothetical protein
MFKKGDRIRVISLKDSQIPLFGLALGDLLFRADCFELVAQSTVTQYGKSYKIDASVLNYPHDAAPWTGGTLAASDLFLAPKKCECDFTGPNCWLGCRCGAFQKASA